MGLWEARGAKAGLEVGEKADFPGAESGRDRAGGRQLWISGCGSPQMSPKGAMVLDPH